jgi:dipeptidase E
MKLFLASSTITDNLVADFESLIGRSIKELKVAFIPDAANGASLEDDISWVAEERQELIDWYNWNITDFILRDSTIEDLEALFDFDVIYVNGGFSGYLARMMRQSGFDKLLPALLDKGVVYVGSSAGSMVMSAFQDASSWYLNEPEPEAIAIPGLGYIDFQIYPHVQDHMIKAIKANCKPDFTYYLLRDGNAISVNGDTKKICGEKFEIVGKPRF